ncbi:hypothetical protein FJU30_03605 [Affinibrenneria salicis]|uniref:DUF3592 domain-containing protein n=1 Tax=Affinibrenneria salicis TaxID=2590031 RepID=A0A5J5G5Y8_9GAMM|nr:hypothetical protein [Affinibrenneria salicis]KAA9002636.1 hypothetical protein FJU30_01160 [Affinibrenneria salicis]KAA9003076.1 hypothetical protein FJU30_03605 [Affinibrenneria salicis]
MKEIIVIFVIIGFCFYMGRDFYINNQINKNGVIATAKIIKAKHLSGNDGGSINGRFQVYFINEHGNEEELTFDTTIPQLYAPRVQADMAIDIKYLPNDHSKALFIFKDN